jgi:CelD/BcsL family acetyltransferase involved in cellulose biosynthesis
LTLEVINDFRALVEIEPEWSSFTRTIAGLTPFQLPEWLLTWWRHFGSGQLHVLVFRHAGEIAGIVPCFVHDWDGRWQMTLIGSGVSDYLEPAIANEHCSVIVDQLQAHLKGNSTWDICNWQDLCFETPLKRLASKIVDDTGCYVIPLAAEFEEYWQARPKNLRRNVRRDRQKAESRGSLEFQVCVEANREPIHALIQLHTARWHKQGQPGMIEANRTAEFLQDVACKFARRDMLRIFSLRFEGRIAAVILGFEYANTLFGYLTAFDPQYEALGLGRILLYESVRYSFEHRYAAWDFLRGEEPYKLWWGAQRIRKCRVIVTRKA